MRIRKGRRGSDAKGYVLLSDRNCGSFEIYSQMSLTQVEINTLGGRVFADHRSLKAPKAIANRCGAPNRNACEAQRAVDPIIDVLNCCVIPFLFGCGKTTLVSCTCSIF